MSKEKSIPGNPHPKKLDEKSLATTRTKVNIHRHGEQDLQAELPFIKSLIDDRLDYFFQKSAATSRLGCAIRHGLLSPGKRFRPVITILSARQCGYYEKMLPGSSLLDAACAVEMVHAASLIMDDLPSMDNARLRRGAPTTHVVFGEAAATLAAVALLNESYKVITNLTDVKPDSRLKALHYLTNAIGIDGLAGGQDQDIACQGGAYKAEARDELKKTATLKEMEKRHLEKTGALFAAAAAIGGAIANCTEDQSQALCDYGCHLGLAYQAYDDVVDVAASSSQSGKDTAQDIDKSTVVSLLGTDGARILAERQLQRAIEKADMASAMNASPSSPTPEGSATTSSPISTPTSPLADLAREVGASFTSLTQ